MKDWNNDGKIDHIDRRYEEDVMEDLLKDDKSSDTHYSRKSSKKMSWGSACVMLLGGGLFCSGFKYHSVILVIIGVVLWILLLLYECGK